MDVLDGCYQSDPSPIQPRDNVTDYREVTVNRPKFIDNLFRVINRCMPDMNQHICPIPCTKVKITGTITGIPADDDLIPEMAQVMGKPGEKSF